jgi:hypothetical protein
VSVSGQVTPTSPPQAWTGFAVASHHEFSLIGLAILLALLAADIGGVIFVVRRNNRLSRAARGAVGGVFVLTVIWAIVFCVQDAGDWGDVVVTNAIAVLYGLIGCGAIFCLDWVVGRLRRPRPLSV